MSLVKLELQTPFRNRK